MVKRKIKTIIILTRIKFINHNNKNSFYICYIFKNPMIIAIYLCHHLLGFMLDCYREKKG